MIEGLLIIVAGIAIYFLPWIIAGSRKHANSGPILALNLLLGWTGIGWVAALVWSLTHQEPKKMAP